MIHSRRRHLRLLAALLPVVMLVGACGGKKGGEVELGDPVRGGSVTMGLEAETGDGWCLQESQLAISGIMVARSIYDTLTVPNADGEYVPYLAESVEPSADYKTWTIKIRDGIKFHDGSDLTAEVVRNNLDAYRGVVGPSDADPVTPHPTREPLLFLFVLQNIKNVEVTGDLEVTVTTNVPWVAFPSFLYYSGRLGITAQAQIDDKSSCATKLIGTGPFMLKDPSDWQEGRQFRAVANPNYWQEAPDGKPYPYLDEIIFQPYIESEQRLNAVENGDIDMAHFSGAPDILSIRTLTEDGSLRSYETNQFGEVSFVQMNNSKPPFDDVRVRKAAALVVDPADYTEVINRGEFEMAQGPFAPGSIAYLKDTPFPNEQDLDEARRLIAEYEAEKGPLPSFTYQATPGTLTQEVATYIQQQLRKIDVEVKLETVQQDALIDNAIQGNYDIMGFRNYPGGDPDELYVWFKGGSPVNFSRFNDPEIDRLLDEGRSEPDEAKRAEIYKNLNRRMGEQVYSVWANFTTWDIASQPNVGGYDPETFPTLPNGDKPNPGLAAGFPTYGIWVQD